MIYVRIASLLMFLAVALGAFGAHALREKLTPYATDIYRTAVLYHFLHALGLFAIAWLSTQTADPKVAWAGGLLCAGIVLFSGSLYALALTGIKALGAITPVGGLCFLVAWALLAFIRH